MLRWKFIVVSGACTALLASNAARADSADQLVRRINAYRSAPGDCEGRPTRPAGRLVAHAALAGVRIGPGTFLEHALDQAGYAAMHAEAISVSGPADPDAVMALITEKYCRTLLRQEFSAVGASRTGTTWQIVLAQPVPALTLAHWKDTGTAILHAVNAARATPRVCGGQRFPAAAPLAWNDLLGEAAMAHSRDMAKRKSLGHQGSDGSQVGERANRVRYQWLRIGENVASGQRTPEDVVAGWISSPGHCANLMNGSFAEMGAAYAINHGTRSGTVYWTQVFGRPR